MNRPPILTLGIPVPTGGGQHEAAQVVVSLPVAAKQAPPTPPFDAVRQRADAHRVPGGGERHALKRAVPGLVSGLQTGRPGRHVAAQDSPEHLRRTARVAALERENGLVVAIVQPLYRRNGEAGEEAGPMEQRCLTKPALVAER